jgi:hypothetical protein
MGSARRRERASRDAAVTAGAAKTPVTTTARRGGSPERKVRSGMGGAAETDADEDGDEDGDEEGDGRGLVAQAVSAIKRTSFFIACARRW